MRKFSFLILTLLILTGCASKRYVKKGAEFESVGYYDKAAEMYYNAIVKNEKNVEAHVGLKKTGQITLDNQLEAFMKSYNNNNTKDAVYQYLEADKFYTRLKSVSINLDFPNLYNDYYNEIKDSYLNDKYNEGAQLLDEESFSEAETIFNEILAIEPGYYDTKELRNIAHYEPIYRKAFDNYNAGKFRSAYYQFSDVNKGIPLYKESAMFEKKALDNATMTIAILNFKNQSAYRNAEVSIYNEVKEQVINIKSPFIKVIDRDMTELLKAEQIYNLEGNVNSETSAKAGKLLGAKYLLSASVSEYRIHTSKPIKTVQKGYWKEKITKTVGEEKVVSYKYHKTNYTEYKQQRQVYCKFSYSLVSAETGEIILSDAFTINESDKIHYATYDGNKKDLYPGTWQSKTKDSPSDEPYTSNAKYSSLQNLLKANKQLESIESMRKQIDEKTASKVAKKIKNYDPEK